MYQEKITEPSSSSSPSSLKVSSSVSSMLQKCCEQSAYSKMSSAETAIMRAVIVLAMIVAVVTVVYLTPIPDQLTQRTCDRPCHDLDWPMICRYKLQVEIPESINGVCESCYNNFTKCNDEFCTSDEISRKFFVTNRQIPGPAIQVCQNDVLVIDVVNKIPGQSLTIHWRGQENVDTPHMDGVPMVTQCPIPSFTTFQYKFRATSAGTHFYHAYSDSDRTNGLFGSLIVRQSKKREPYQKLYDIDDKDHVILINEWSESNLILINGKTPTQSSQTLSTFHVTKGKRYRFRMAYTSGSTGCPVTISIDNHLLKIIGIDGKPTTPYEVSSMILTKGERLDFVLKANQDKSSFFLRAKSHCNKKSDGLAVIDYGNGGGALKVADKSQLAVDNRREFDTALCEGKLGKICLSDLKGLQKMPEELRRNDVDRTVFLMLGVKTINIDDNFQSKIYAINNISFTFPSSPLLTQLDDLNQDLICNQIDTPITCTNQDFCECIHVEHIPLGATIETIIINQENEEHIFHLHGHYFYVIGYRQLEKTLDLSEIKKMNENEVLFKRNFNSPVMKDTIRIPKNSAVALRFVANSPGFWMLRDEKSKGWTRGMDLVFQVGDLSDVPSTPDKFPTCGSFIGPNYFLI